MLPSHSPDQFKRCSAVGFSRITSRLERIAVYIEIVFHHIWDEEELQSKTSIWLVMKTLLMCWWCWVWQYESQP